MYKKDKSLTMDIVKIHPTALPEPYGNATLASSLVLHVGHHKYGAQNVHLRTGYLYISADSKC